MFFEHSRSSKKQPKKKHRQVIKKLFDGLIVICNSVHSTWAILGNVFIWSDRKSNSFGQYIRQENELRYSMPRPAYGCFTLFGTFPRKNDDEDTWLHARGMWVRSNLVNPCMTGLHERSFAKFVLLFSLHLNVEVSWSIYLKNRNWFLDLRFSFGWTLTVIK